MVRDFIRAAFVQLKIFDVGVSSPMYIWHMARYYTPSVAARLPPLWGGKNSQTYEIFSH